jgi:hypothetical protein
MPTGNWGKTRGVIAGLVPAISIGMARRPIIEMAGTSPAMTAEKWFNITGMAKKPPNRVKLYVRLSDSYHVIVTLMFSIRQELDMLSNSLTLKE